jgi:cytochrome c6
MMSHLLRRFAVCAASIATLSLTAPTALGGAGMAEKPSATANTTTKSKASSSGAADEAMLETGRQVFLEEALPSCTICHTLADAGASGQIGPNLDQLQPSLEMVRQAVAGGVGIMPAYGGQLSAAQIEAVAHYVSTVAAEEP